MSTLIDFVIGIFKKISDLILEKFFPEVLRKVKSRDKEYFKNMYELFDRRSFKGPFTWNCNMQEYLDELDKIRKSIATGITPNAEPGETRGKSLIVNKKWRQVIEETDNNLHRIKMIVEGKEQVAPQEQYKLIDKLRDDTIRNLNTIWEEMKLVPLPIPTEVKVYYA